MAKTTFLQARGVPFILTREQRGKGMLALIPSAGEGLWRGHAFQGRDQPGRRAVLEETNLTSDLVNSTANERFSQAQTDCPSTHIAIIFNEMESALTRSLWAARRRYPERY